MIPAWLLLLAAIAVVTALVVGLILLWRLWHVFFPKPASAPARAAAIAVVLLLWSSTVRSVLTALYNLVHELVVAFENQELLSNPQYRYSVTEILFGSIGSIPYPNIALALLALILLVRFFEALETGKIPTWLNPLRKVKEAIWINTLVLVIFFAGVYLIAASLCTIPALEVNQPFSEAERLQINSRIDAIAPADAFNKQFPESLPESPDGASELRSLVESASGSPIKRKSCTPSMSETPAAAPGAGQNGSTPVTPKESAGSGPQPDLTQLLKSDTDLLAVVKDVIEEYDDQYCQELASYQSLRNTTTQTEQTAADNVRNQINSDVALRLTGAERAKYVYSLTSHYAELVNNLQSQLTHCKSEISGAGQNSSLVFLRNTLRLAASELRTDPHPLSALTLRASLQEDDREDNVSACEFRGYNPGTPDNPIPFPQLGVFTFLFGWLQNSDSLPLAVICGMLGVGLIGCILSSFVRQHLTPQPHGLWIPDPFPVVIRGFTAAIVVYLAIEGGLNVFSAQTNQANPYVLLFFCLVGAVFSEDVWVAAHSRLKSADIGANRDGNPKDGPTEEEEAKPKNEQAPGEDQKNEVVTAEKPDAENQDGETEVSKSSARLDGGSSAPSGNDREEDDKTAS